MFTVGLDLDMVAYINPAEPTVMKISSWLATSNSGRSWLRRCQVLCMRTIRKRIDAQVSPFRTLNRVSLHCLRKCRSSYYCRHFLPVPTCIDRSCVDEMIELWQKEEKAVDVSSWMYK